jgi:hypothetical protein
MADTNYQIYPQQLKAGKEILEYMGEGIPNVRWNILFAQPQSGKSHTFYFVAAEMMRKEKIKHIVIICGNPDTDLKKQTENAKDEFLNVKYDAYLEEELGMIRGDRVILLSSIKTNIHLVWGNDLTKEPEFKRDTLIIWEESHAAQKKGMRPDTFFKNMDISCDGNVEKLERNNNYVLSVSATPFSEISDIIHDEGNQFKHKVQLEVDDGYYGIETMIETGRIQGFKKWPEKLDEAMKMTNEEKVLPKYAIIRVKNDSLADEVKSIACNNGWTTKECNSNRTAEMKNLDILKEKPTQHTIIIIKGMCRMGKVVDKEHIAFVMETSNDSNSDVVLQGLVARMFGWHKLRDINVYINQRILNRDEFQRYIGQISGGNVIPTRATNLVKPKAITSNQNNEIIPIRIRKNDRIIDGSEDVSYLDKNLKNEIIESCCSCLADNRCINFNSQEQLNEIVTNLTNFPRENIRIIRINESPKSYVKIADKINQSISSRTPGLLGSTGGCDDEEIKIYVFKKSDNVNNISTEDAFIVARTESGNGNENAIKELIRNVPKTTKKEVFCGRTETEEEVESNGVYSIPISVDTSFNGNKMKTTLSELIRLSIKNPKLNMPRKIISNYSNNPDSSFKWNGVIVSQEINIALQPGGKIFKDIEAKYGVKLKLIKAKGRQLKFPSTHRNYVRYAEIVW